MHFNVLALTAGLAATASAFDCSGPYFSFYNRGGSAMSYQRLDPALFPGTQSPHLHTFDGGNGLAESMGFDTTQQSSCSTARVKTDKSLYWRPTLFWNGNNTGFYRVPEKFTKIYYKFGDAGNVRADVKAFPEGFSMIAGDPFKRADGDNPGGVKWACLGEGYSRIDANGFPKGFTSCKEGLTSEITFPACWNGQDIDPKNPSAHMAYPTNGGKGLEACPESHREARFPTIFIEFWYDVSQFDGQYDADSVPWALANGDPTGFGFHADFMNGWEKGVLEKAIAPEGYCNCGCGCGNDQMKQCFGAENVNDDSDADFKSCAAKAVYGGDEASPLEKLPGCNPLQSGPAKATQATGEGCNATPAPSTDKPAASSAASASKSAAAGVTGLPNADDAGLGGSDDEFDESKPSASKTAVSADKQDVEASATPYPTSNAPSKEEDQPVQEDPKPTPSETKNLLPTLSIASTGIPADTTGAPTNDEEDCKSKSSVYVTLTPTVYVTEGSVDAETKCDLGTVTKTITNTATVTVAYNNYRNKKRHMNAHGHMH